MKFRKITRRVLLIVLLKDLEIAAQILW